MESLSYTSCIKINGVPLLPPVMTDDIKAEMNYYKKLAIAIEEKQKDLQTIPKIKKSSIKYSADIITNYDKTESKIEYVHQKINKTLGCDNESININTVIDVMSPKTNKIPPAQNEGTILLLNAKKCNTHKFKPKVFHKTQNRKSVSNDNSLVPNRKDLFDKIESRLASVINDTALISQVSKPEVPTSLDIIPITMDEPLNKQDRNATITLQTSNTYNIPKLVRQGSYVLEAPSPMLLAHLQSELLNENNIPAGNYVPTSTSTARRKEWKITQGKTEWENQTKYKQCIIIDSSKKSSIIDCMKKSVPIIPTVYQPAHKSQAKAEVDIPRLTRSVDCIQGMLVEECMKNKNVFYNQRHTSDVNVEISYSPQIWQANKNISILNLENKLSKSLGNLNTGTQCFKRIEKDAHENLTKNNVDYKALSDNNLQNSTNKLLSSMTSEKLILILKQIQEVHKKQILQLVTCQQRAQILLQKEFEKQQMVLLTHIKKSLPEIPLIETSEIISSIHSNTTTNYNEDSQSIAGTSTANLDDLEDLNCRRKLKKTEIISLRKDHIEKLACPLNYIFPNNESTLDTKKWCQSSTIVKTYPQNIIDLTPLGSRDCEELHNNYNGDSKTNNQHEGMNISRQLFPLNCNTTYVPILDHIGYTEKHVHAASVINAYARGYLVRRLMTTERVFTLKSTYKEALQCMLRLHIDAPLNLPELNFLHRLQLQCDAASTNIVDLFAQSPAQKMQVIAHDRELKRSRLKRPSSTRSHSFATQRTLARKKFREYDSA